jgi:hypothetical protein
VSFILVCITTLAVRELFSIELLNDIEKGIEMNMTGGCRALLNELSCNLFREIE